MKYNEKLQSRIDEVAEVAGYLWEKGWAERNGGNISYNITDVVDDNIRALTPVSEKFPIGKPVPALSGNYFLVTGTGKRMRYVHSSPMDNASIIRISGDGSYYEIMAEKPIRPTSELPSHLMIYNHMAEQGPQTRGGQEIGVQIAGLPSGRQREPGRVDIVRAFLEGLDGQPLPGKGPRQAQREQGLAAAPGQGGDADTGGRGPCAGRAGMGRHGGHPGLT